MRRVLLSLFIVAIFAVSCSALSFEEYCFVLGISEPNEVDHDNYQSVADMQYEDFRSQYAPVGSTLVSQRRSDLGLSLEVPEENLLLVDSSKAGSSSLQNIPSSGSAYSDPQLIGTEYAEAEDGSLLSVLYSLFGRPVRAYHYRYTSSSSSGYTYYTVETLDCDYNWLAQVVVFLVVLWSIFRLGGVLISKT